MNAPQSRNNKTPSPSLDDLIEEMTDRLQQGESIDVEEFVSRRPDKAERLRKLFPTLQAMASIGDELDDSRTLVNRLTREGLGPYEIQCTIGQGGMGVVLKGRDDALGRVVAIKVLAPELASSATARRRFLREGKAAAAVSHPHVVTIHAVSDDQGLPYLVMEFVSGESLRQKLDREGPLELVEILRVGIQVAGGLAAAHEHGVIHRDIKPANILLENGVQRVKITDFGLARAVDDVQITRSGEVTGTPQYMSPEQAQSEPVDQRSDLFSLGCLLYAMATGRSPFRAETTMAALRRVCDDTPRPIREINPDLPEWFCELVGQLLEKDPERRPQTAQQVKDALSQHLHAVQNPSTPRPRTIANDPANARSEKRSTRTRWIAAAAVALLLFAGLGLTEATGVTHVSEFVATVLRIRTPDGTLVVRVSDPDVSVSLDGENLSISGTGVRTLELDPGEYRFRASKDGEPFQEELVTITRGGQEIVDVSLEGTQDLSAANGESTVDTNDGWVSLFNGQNLDGWHVLSVGRGDWSVEDGVLVGRSEPSSYLMSDRGDYENFHLRAELQIGNESNSGVMFYAEDELTLQDGKMPLGYQAAILGGTFSNRQRTGSLFKAIHPLINAGNSLVAIHESTVSPNTWGTLEVIARGGHLTIRVNDRVTADTVDGDAAVRRGHIGLQVCDPGSEVRFRRVEIRELDEADLTPWESEFQRFQLSLRSGEWDAAANSFTRTMILLPESREGQQLKTALYRSLSEYDEVFSRIAKQEPDNVELWLQRGKYFARRAQWKQAAEYYAEPIERDQTHLDDRVYARLLLLSGQEDSYRELCRDIFEYGKASNDWIFRRVAAMVCTLSPDSDVDAAICLKWAETAVEQERNKFTLHTLAAASYRTGEFQKTVDLLGESVEEFGASRNNAAFLLALAHHRMGHAEKSHQWYAYGRDQLQEARSKTPDEPAPWALTHWLNLNVWYREAKPVLEPEVAPEDQESWIDRAYNAARRSQWAEAAESFERFFEADDSVVVWRGGGEWFGYPYVLLLSGDRQDYREVCAKVAADSNKFRNWDGYSKAALMCTADPESGIDPAICVEWAEHALALQRNKFTLRALAAARYRAGQHEETVKLLKEAMADYEEPLANAAFLIAAAHSQLGHNEESRKWYQMGIEELERLTADNADVPVPVVANHWLNINIWYREAKAVLKEEQPLKAPAPDIMDNN